MLKKSNKRRRTKAQLEEEKQEEVLKRQRLAADMAELATLRLRVEKAERDAQTNVSAGNIMSQMISAGIAKQTAGDTIAINTAAGVQSYSVAAPETEVQIDFDAGLNADGMEESDQKKE